MANTTYEPVVGFEIHVELKTASKMFCGCKNDPFFAPAPNTYTCPVCLGLPGALPVPNKKAVEWTIMLGLALGCRIPLFSKFDRKHYFYPDLPKGYQISQYDQPLAVDGKLGDVRIKRVHLEEDTAKLMHTSLEGENVSLVDFNRSGVPLVEIVTEPDIRSGEQAKELLKKIHQIIKYLGISDADMEKGSMRLEPNISVRKSGAKDLPPYKVEVKNINSFNFAKRAIEFETDRHIAMLGSGEMPAQENRGWNEQKGVTIAQRSKEEAEDYRYFPDPDIPPMRWTEEYVKKLAGQLPELPDAKVERLQKSYGLSQLLAWQIADTRHRADFFEEAADAGRKTNIEAKTIANRIVNKQADLATVSADEFIQSLVAEKEVTQLPQAEFDGIITSVLSENEKAVTDYKNGKEQSLMFLLGQVQKKLKGKAPVPQVLAQLKKVMKG